MKLLMNAPSELLSLAVILFSVTKPLDNIHNPFPPLLLKVLTPVRVVFGAFTTITLKGMFTINNTAGSFVNLAGTLVTVRACP